MRCMKCGRETESEQVFCPSCLDVMDQFPVKPGTPVTIPKRPNAVKKFQPSKQEQMEDQVQRMRRSIKTLKAVVLVLTLTLGLLSGAVLAQHLLRPELEEKPAIGQNYSTEETTFQERYARR